MSAFMLHMHTERHSFKHLREFHFQTWPVFGKVHSKSASAKFNENEKFRPWIATKCVLAAGLCPGPLGELKRSPDLLAAIRGPTSKGGEGRGKGREGGREGEGRGEGRGGEGEAFPLENFSIYTPGHIG